MAICPVCEHQQEFGFECEVCGKVFGGLDELGPPPVAPERVEGLEVTRVELGEVPVQRLGELEVTHHAAVQVAVQAIPEVEQNAAAPVGPVAVERLAELSVDRVPDDGQRTALPTGGPITCRYCRNVQAAGSLCERCGMKLPAIIIVPDVVGGKLLSAEDVKTRCRACGAPATAGQRCGDCGRDVPYPEA